MLKMENLERRRKRKRRTFNEQIEVMHERDQGLMIENAYYEKIEKFLYLILLFVFPVL
jgi:hypothetical protein